MLQIKNRKEQDLFGILEVKQTKKLVLIIHGEQGLSAPPLKCSNLLIRD
jgi:hypothetical protein